MKRLLLVVIMAAMTGCMYCRDGKMHTLVTGIQIERAIESAECQGMVRALTTDGGFRWLNSQEALAYKMELSDAAYLGQPFPMVNSKAGLASKDLRAQKYAWYARMTAWLADAATLSAVTYGAAEAANSFSNNGNSGDDNSQEEVNITVAGDGNQVEVNQ